MNHRIIFLDWDDKIKLAPAPLPCFLDFSWKKFSLALIKFSLESVIVLIVVTSLYLNEAS